MTFESRLAEHLEFEEGRRLMSYHCSEGKLTIGIGRNLDAKGISDDEADLMLANDMEDAVSGAMGLVSDFRGLPENVKIVLSSMVFQMGANGVSKFVKMIMAVKIGAYNVAAIEMLNSVWAKQTPNRAKRLAEMMRNA